MRWWRAEGARVYEMVCSAFDRIEQGDQDRLAALLTHARLYGGTKIAGLGPSQYHSQLPSERLKRNVVASCTDTAVAKIAKNRPAPQFVTNGGDWKTRRKAERLTKFGKGMLHQVDAYRIGPTIVRDACIFGTGIGKIIETDGRLAMERTLPWEVFVDQMESLYGEPRQIFQRRYVDKGVLLELYDSGRGAGERRAAIELAPEPPRSGFGRDLGCDQVEVLECWRLPSGRDANDGKHVIVTRRGTLLEEPWTQRTFPFAVLRWEDPLVGFWGRGMAERLTGIQFEINKLLQRIQIAMHLLSVSKIVMDEAAGVPKSHVDNETGTIYVINRGGNAPTVVPQQAVHPEMFAQVDRLVAGAFEEVGLSQLSATARKPAGLDSGVALREYNDIESERFVVAAHRCEEWYLDVVRRGLEVARGIDGFSIDVPDKRDPVTLSWADVDLDTEAYTLQCFPVSLLPQTPAARIQTVQELMAGGLIDQETSMEMLDLPDLEEMYDRVTASRRHIRKMVERMLDGGPQEMPEGDLNLADAVQVASAALWAAEDQSAPDEVIERVRVFRDSAAALLVPPPAPAAAPGAMPMGAPAPAGAPMPAGSPAMMAA